MMEKLLRAAIYIRVSTWEQATYGKSLDAQLERLKRYAEEHNMVVSAVYADEGQTARKELKKRKAIHQLLEAVKADKIDVILFCKMDRWFRNVADFYKVQDILDAHNVTWIAVEEPNINMETRDGRLCLNLALSIGQNEVDTTSERIKFVVDNTIRNGGLVWGEVNVGFGYTIAEVDGKKRMVKDPATQEATEDAIQYFLAHQGVRATVLYIQEKYDIPDFSYIKMKNILKSEFYMGKYRDNWNYCPAYMTKETHDKIQDILSRNIKKPRSNRIYLFSGLLRCPLCGVKLSGRGNNSIINRKTGEKRSYCYYRCNNAHTNNTCTYRHNVSQNLIEQYLVENIEKEYERFQIRCQVKPASPKGIAKKEKTAAKIRQELDRLNILFQKGRLDYEYYESEYARLEKELQEANVIQMPVPVKDTSHIEMALSSDFQALYGAMDMETRRCFWRNTIKQIFLTEDNQIDKVDFL